MATPQRPNPNDPLRDLETNQTQNAVDRHGTGRGAWIWIVIALVIVGVVWVAWWGWSYRGGGRGTNTGAGPVSGPPGPNGAVTDRQGVPPANGPAASVSGPLSGSGVPALNAENKRSFIGRVFEVHNVPVQESPSNGVVWVGNTGSAPTLVVLAHTGNSAASTILGHGHLVDVTGTVVKAPSEAQAKHDWRLSSQAATQLEQEGAYVRATQVETSAR